MKTLTIKDLARTEQLDRTAMAAVRGGWSMSSPSYPLGGAKQSRSFDSSIHATQNLMQAQHVLNATANGSAFTQHLNVHNDVSQDGKNVIVG
jgi:hypothetical protein